MPGECWLPDLRLKEGACWKRHLLSFICGPGNWSLERCQLVIVVGLHVVVLMQERKNLGIQIQIPEAQEECLSSVLNSITSQTRRVRPGDTLFPNGRKYRSSHFPGFPLVQCPLLRIPRALLFPVMLPIPHPGAAFSLP